MDNEAIGVGSKVLVIRVWVLAVTPRIKLLASLRFSFQAVIDSWMAVTFASKHAACYYACINILINTRCSIGKVITCHLSGASSKKSLPCNCSVIYLGGMRYIPQSLSPLNSLRFPL